MDECILEANKFFNCYNKKVPTEISRFVFLRN